MARLFLVCVALLVASVSAMEWNIYNKDYWADKIFLWNETLTGSEKAVEFFTQHIDDYGQLTAPGTEHDISFYYKLPLALFTGGRWREANRVLDFIQENFIREDGDVRTSDELKTSSFALNEYYHYTNGWILMAAQRMERFDISRPLYAYLKRYFDGFPTQGPADEGNTMTDMFSAAHFGMISLFMGDIKTAKKAGQMVLKIMRKQPDMETGIYLRMDGNGDLITEYDPGMAAFHLVNKTAEYQLHFMEGYPALFLIRLYEATKNDCYLDAAKAIVEFAVECDNTMYLFHYTHKLGVAMSHLYRITGDRTLLFHTEQVVAWLYHVQNEDGTFLNYEDNSYADIYDQSAEIAVWLRAIDANVYHQVKIYDDATKP